MITNNSIIPYNNLLIKISWLSASTIVKYAIQTVIIILLANVFSVEDYGAYQHVWFVINSFCTIIPFGLAALLLSTNTSALFNYILQNKKSIVCIAITSIVALLSYILFAMQSFTLYEKIFLFALVIFQIVAIVGETILVKQAKEKTIFCINSIYYTTYLLIHYFIVIRYYNLATLLLGLLIITLIKTFFLFMLKNKNEQNYIEENNIKKDWLYLGTNDVFNVFVKWMDKWIVLLLWPTTSFAIYFNGTYEIPIFLLLLGAVGSVSVVEIKKIKKDNTSAIVNIIKQPVLTLAAIALPSFAFLYFNASYLFQVLFANKYVESVPIFIITLLLIPSRIIYSTSVLQVFGKNKIIVKGVVIELVLAIVLMVILYPIINQKGFALAFVIANYIQLAYYLWHTAKFLNKKIIDLIPIFYVTIILTTALIIAKVVFEFTAALDIKLAIVINSIACFANMIAVYFIYVKAKRN